MTLSAMPGYVNRAQGLTEAPRERGGSSAFKRVLKQIGTVVQPTELNSRITTLVASDLLQFSRNISLLTRCMIMDTYSIDVTSSPKDQGFLDDYLFHKILTEPNFIVFGQTSCVSDSFFTNNFGEINFADKHISTGKKNIGVNFGQTAAQDAVREIRELSGLNNEEIAPLVNVSRRSLQAWIAGERISARKEQRLRTLVDIIREISLGNRSTTRRRLLDRLPGGLRPYDLLVEGHDVEAKDLFLGRRRMTAQPAAEQAHDLPAQLGRVEDGLKLPEEQLFRRFSRRLGK